MTDKKIIKFVRKIKPTKISHLRSRLQCKRLGSGAFRTAYTLSKNLVVKFSQESDHDHAQNEIKIIRRIFKFKKYRALRKYIPKVYYADCETGVIVMERLSLMSMHEAEKHCSRLENAFTKRQLEIGDLHYYNIGLSSKGRLKILDFGCSWEMT